MEPLLNGFAKVDRAVTFKVGSFLRVRWADGSVEDLPVGSRKVYGRVSDMGHEYDVSYSELEVLTSHNGTPIRVSLLDVDVSRSSLRRENLNPNASV